jgi:hypothetical protein
VIWQSSTSPRSKTARIRAGRTFWLLKSVKRERHGHRIARYKSFHASSSSAEFQSGPHAV